MYIVFLLFFVALIWVAWFLGGKAGKKRAEEDHKEFLSNLKHH